MKKIVFIIIALAIVLLLTLVNLQRTEHSEPALIQHGLPWQIALVEGKPRTFFLTLGVSTLSDAEKTIGDDYELAIMAVDKTAALEMFYPSFNAGPFTGKLILVADIHAAALRTLMDESPKYKMLETGVKKMQLAFAQKSIALEQRIKSMTFAPVARLDKALVEQHFGKAHSQRKVSEHEHHLFYPHLGLRIIINEKGKDFIEYTLPFAPKK